jgi:Tfp pilus assembly protein PilF
VRPRFALCLAAGCLGLVVSSAGAQNSPHRPPLDASADTNDANAYYNYGLTVVEKEPEKGAAAFYWASQLNPAMADAFYARRVALLLEDPRRLLRYWQGDKRVVQAKDIRRIDSLYYHALTLNPFVPERLEHVIFDAVLDELSVELEDQVGASPTEIRAEVQREMFDAPPELQAYQAHAEGRMQDALSLYARAIDNANVKASLRIDRATVFYETGQLDSALAELTAAAKEMQKRDNKDLVYVYNSKALLQHRIAVIDLQLGKIGASRDALAQALQEDLSYSPAHVYLAYLAMQSHDTTTALSEMDLAIQLRQDDPALQYGYAAMLVQAGQPADAAPHLRAAIKLDAVYAQPHFLLAQVLEKQDSTADAAAEYAAFLALSAKTAGERAAAQARLAALRPGGAPDLRP